VPLGGRRSISFASAQGHSSDRLNGDRWQIVAEFIEVESGKRASRPQLDAAIAACKKQKAKLIVAKLDRLSRNVSFC
jgi:DNA invertase Pin-like site-specific DNA recombinase